MRAEDLLKELPIKFYVIDLKNKNIIQTNDAQFKIGKQPCFAQLFNKDKPCSEKEGCCLCQRFIKEREQGAFIIDNLCNGNKKFVNVNAKKINNDFVIVSLFEATREIILDKMVKINKHKLRRAEKLASFGSWEINLDNYMFSFSKGACDILGLNSAVLSYQETKELLLPEYREKMERELALLINEKKQYNIQYQIKRLIDGNVRYIHSMAEYRKSKNMVFGVAQDISLNKRVEKELYDTNNLLSTIIQNIPDAIYMKDKNYRKVIVNKGDLKNCGDKKRDEVIGKTDYEIYPKNVAERYYYDDRLVIENGQQVINREELLPGEQDKWILTTKVPLKNEENEIIGLVGIGHDITQRKEMEEELKSAKLKAEESDKLKSLFLTNMSHEIRTPLNGILGFSNIICSGNVKKCQLKEFGEIIQNCGKRLTAVIEDIIDISLIQSNQLNLEYTTFDINDLLEEMYMLYKFSYEKKIKNIQFSVNYCAGKEKNILYLDKNKLFHILKKLLDNAFKFTVKGFIRYGVSELSDENEFVLFVQDSGIGINEDKIDIVFDVFRQAAEGFSRQYDGTGLGLAIVAGILKKMGGRVWVNSKINEGSVFFVAVPINNNSENFNKKWTENTITKKIIRRRVISFEDDPVSVEYLKQVMKLMKFDFVNFSQPSIGLDYIRSNEVDLVLMDLRMPEMNGFEVTKIIKKEFPDLPVIIQTAYAMKEDEQRAYLAGCDDFLTKPVSIDDLKIIINRFSDGNINC